MFGMDMGLDMMGMGAMEMDIGAMQMGMGMGMMGADMMAMGAMDMGMGMRMQGMGLGMGMGMGMMGGGIGICPVGCMGACCRPMPVCVGGCIGPCYCTNTQVVVRNAPFNQYNDPNNGFVRLPPITSTRPPQQYPQQQYSQQQFSKQQIPVNQGQQTQVQNVDRNQMYAKGNGIYTTPNNDIQEQQIISEQMRIEQQKNEQILLKQKLQQQQLMLQKQKLQFQQRQLQQQKIDQMRMQQIKQKQRIQRLRRQQEQLQRQMYQQQQANKNLQNRQTNGGFAYQPQQVQAQSNPYEQQQQVLIYGDIYQQIYNKWQPIHGVKLTKKGFLNKKIQHISKIKVKCQSHIPNTKVIKLTCDGTGDIFISVPCQEQVDWMCKIIWLRLERMGKSCSINEPFNGTIEGQIVRKSTFSGWQVKHAMVNSSGLKLTGEKGGSITHTVTSVPQIWTRFEIIHGNMLVVKMHNMGRKLQLGIPVENAIAWLKALYSLVHS